MRFVDLLLFLVCQNDGMRARSQKRKAAASVINISTRSAANCLRRL